jgi:hypothetical protein
MHDPAANPPPRYRWPRYALAGVILFFALSVLWLWREVHRVRHLQQHRVAVTNTAPAPPPGPP